MSDDNLDDRLAGWKHRISELEKKYETIGIKIPETIHKYYDKNRTEIAELREKVEGIYKSVHGIEPNDADTIWANLEINQNGIKRLNEQLNELKDANVVRHNECSGVYDDLLSLKGVLQELKKGIMNDLYDKKAIRGLRLNEVTFLEVLEKLDSGGEKFMESDAYKQLIKKIDSGDEPREDDRECLGCREKFEGGVHAFMCGTCTFKLLNEGIIVKREDLERIFFIMDFEGFWDEMEDASLSSMKRIKEEYNL